MSNIRKGDNVVVVSGSDKGKKGSVLKVFPKENRALVQGINMVKRHQRQTQTQQAGIVSKAAPVHLSNVAHIDPKSGTAKRICFKKVGEGRRVALRRSPVRSSMSTA
jgi:large subunit ribosomal protein L24